MKLKNFLWKDRPPGKWLRSNFEGKPFKFFPVLYLSHPNQRSVMPLSLKFTLSLLASRLNIEGRILDFHRVESALPYAFRDNRKVLYVHHGDTREYLSPGSEAKWRHIPWLYFQLVSRLIPGMSRIYVVTEKARESYGRKYRWIGDRFTLLPSWSDPKVFYPYSESTREADKSIFTKEKGWSETTRLVFFAGRFELQKDPLLLVEVFRYLSTQYDDEVKLLLAGEGSLIGPVQKRIKEASLERDTHSFGGLSQRELAKIMNISDVLILTSFTEGSPRVVLEAQACGLPVVSPNVGEVGMVIREGKSGHIVQKRDCSELGEAVLDILKNKERFSVDNCLQSVKSFTPEEVLREVYSYYHRLAN